MHRMWLVFLALLLVSASGEAGPRGVVILEDKEGNEVAQYRESHALLIGVVVYAKG